jgi:hypothetical protein
MLSMQLTEMHLQTRGQAGQLMTLSFYIHLNNENGHVPSTVQRDDFDHNVTGVVKKLQTGA